MLSTDVVWISLGHATTILFGLVGVRLFTELAPREVFGGASLMTGVMVFVVSGLIAPVTQCHVRYQAEYTQEGHGDRYAWTMMLLALATSVVAASLVMLALLFVAEMRAGAGLTILPIVLAWALATAIRSIIVGRLNAERRQRDYSQYLALEALLVLLLTAAALSLSVTVEAILFGQVAGMSLTFCLLWHVPCKPRKEVREKSDFLRRVRGKIISYGVPFSVIFRLEWLVNQSDRYILGMYLDLAAVGVYAAAFGLASRPSIITATIISDHLRPALFSSQKTSPIVAAKFVRFWLLLQFVCSLLIVLGFYTLGESLAQLMLAEPYRNGAPELMIWISAAYGIRAIALVLENCAYAFEQSRRIALAKGVPVVVGISMALLLVPQSGAAGAAMANCAAQLVYMGACAVILRLPSRPAAQIT
ncbi:MAG: oligosaccharide flippase family protein [Pseudomonadota bacterium]